MGATIYYQPQVGMRLDIGARSAFLTKLREATGQHSAHIQLGGCDCFVLQGLRAGLDSDDQKAAIDQLIEAIQKYGEVRVWAEY